MTPSNQATQNKVRLRSAIIIDALSALNYSFRYNELTNTIEVNGEPITDAIEATIRRDMRDLNVAGIAAIQDAYIAHASENTYHPIKDCFNSFKWDGFGHIKHLTSYITDTGPIDDEGNTWIYKAMRRWLIGYVARIYERQQLPMLILEGTQRKGKSTLVKWLSSILPDKYFYEGPIAPDNKDSLIRLATKFIWEVNELGSTIRRSDVEALKGFITLNNVTVRMPYGKRDISLAATAGMIGTINDASGFLNDSTGTRRALIVPVTSINWDYYKEVNLTQVWAEAIAAYTAGESTTLTNDERETQAQINVDYEAPNSVEDSILSYYDIDENMVNDPAWFVSANDIRQVIDVELKGTSQQHALAIAAILKKHGAIRQRTYIGNQRVRGFFGVRRKFP